MKYIKLYENNYEVVNYYIDESLMVKINPKNIDKINKILCRFDESYTNNNTLEYHINKNDIQLVTIIIFLDSDDYYFVDLYDNVNDDYSIYKCDQLNGLISLLKSGKISYI